MFTTPRLKVGSEREGVGVMRRGLKSHDDRMVCGCHGLDADRSS